jgi:hypothetical protein
MSKEKSQLPTKLTADTIPVMLEQVKNQIKEITGGGVKSEITNGSIPGFGKINDIKTLDNIIKATSSVTGRAKAYKEAAELVVPTGVKKPQFKIDGMSEAAMVNHLKARAIEVGRKEQLDVLKKIQKELEDNLTAEQKRENSLAKIQALIEAQQ